MIRLHHPDAREGPLTVRGPAHHYLAHVHRLTPGAALEVFDGRGHAFAATVQAAGPASIELELSAPAEAPRVRPVTVVQGMPKGDKLELVVQKATELWATAVMPVFCERSVVKRSGSDGKKAARWQKIADEAARQCGRSATLTVAAPATLEAALGLDAAWLVLDEAEQPLGLAQAVRALPPDAPLALVVGPEGGLSPAERALLERRGARRVSLGPLVLRTETAALAALAVVRHLDGLLG